MHMTYMLFHMTIATTAWICSNMFLHNNKDVQLFNAGQ